MPEKFSTISQSRVRARYNLNKEEDTSGRKIIIGIFVALVVVIGIGAIILLAKGKKSDSGTSNESQQETPTETTADETGGDQDAETTEDTNNETESATDTTTQDNGTSTDGIPVDADFSAQNQQVGDATVIDAEITKLTKTSNTGFYRLEFTIESSTDFPLTTAELKSATNSIKLKVVGITADDSGINPGNASDVTDSVVSTVFHEVTSEANTSIYQIGIKATTDFYLHTLNSPKRIVLDIKEQAVTDGDGQEFAFSTNPQTIIGNASGNIIYMSGVSYSNQGTVFRIIYKLGTIGSGTIPNATAEITDYEGGKAIKVVISNMNSDFAASGNYDVTYSDKAVSGMKGSFSGGTSTYYIKLTSVREYQLYYRTAPAQLLVDVKR